MLLNTTRPFTRAQALAAGMTLRELIGPRYQRIFHGVYLDQTIRLDVRHRALAALLIAPPDARASHHTAVRLWGGCAPPTTETHISVRAPGHRSLRRGITSHRLCFDGAPSRIKGVAVSNPTQAFLELASTGIGLVELVVAGDSLARRGRATPAQLISAADEYEGRRASLARRAARYVRSGVDSPMESRVRMLIVLAGLPEPVVNLIIRRADGSWLHRFELSYPDYKIIIEYDGHHHLYDLSQWDSDLRRRESLERAGWRSVIITSEAFYGSPIDVLTRIREALRSRGAVIPKRKLPAEWRRCFPDRSASTAPGQDHERNSTAVENRPSSRSDSAPNSTSVEKRTVRDRAKTKPRSASADRGSAG